MTGDLELRALLCDFGYTKATGKDQITSSSLSDGSLVWRAWELVHPQVLMDRYNISREDRIGYLLPKSDVWSWGMTALVCIPTDANIQKRGKHYWCSLLQKEVFNERYPFSELDTPFQVSKHLLDGINPIIHEDRAVKNGMNGPFKDIINACWEPDPRKRPSIADVLKHLQVEPLQASEILRHYANRMRYWWTFLVTPLRIDFEVRQATALRMEEYRCYSTVASVSRSIFITTDFTRGTVKALRRSHAAHRYYEGFKTEMLQVRRGDVIAVTGNDKHGWLFGERLIRQGQPGAIIRIDCLTDQ
jgi:serine/threonine protein kinase